MDYITIKEVAEKWGLKERRVQVMCQEEKIPGVKRFGHSWAIPANAERPVDGRVKSGKYIKRRQVSRNE
ncbi:MAG: helix-turn-helix domain-containing protein [Eubacterium sp.]|nr:helix-turn-helix domain-containing protein [Eubacterium sp.]